MAEEAEGLGKFPLGEGVGGETAVDEGHARGKEAVVQVGIEAAQLAAGEHTFIYNGAAGQGADVEVLVRARAAFHFFANAVQAALEGYACLLGAGDKHLTDGGYHAPGGLACHFLADGHLAQVHQLQTLAFGFFAEDAEKGFLARRVAGQEEDACAVVTLFGHGDAL